MDNSPIKIFSKTDDFLGVIDEFFDGSVIVCKAFILQAGAKFIYSNLAKIAIRAHMAYSAQYRDSWAIVSANEIMTLNPMHMQEKLIITAPVAIMVNLYHESGMSVECHIVPPVGAQMRSRPLLQKHMHTLNRRREDPGSSAVSMGASRNKIPYLRAHMRSVSVSRAIRANHGILYGATGMTAPTPIAAIRPPSANQIATPLTSRIATPLQAIAQRAALLHTHRNLIVSATNGVVLSHKRKERD